MSLTHIVNRCGDAYAVVRRFLGLARRPRHYGLVAEPGRVGLTLRDILR